jgi:TfoX/Sxy family transcriptional regulator of competence genes
MAYDEALAGRVRAALAAEPDVAERRMFGGVAFMVRGHMCCGVVGEELMVRVGAAGHADALGRPHVRPMDFTGRPMTGMVYVGRDGLAAEADLRGWVERGADHARSLPPKQAAQPAATEPRRVSGPTTDRSGAAAGRRGGTRRAADRRGA